MTRQEFLDILDVLDEKIKELDKERKKVVSASWDDIKLLGKQAGLIQAKGAIIDYWKMH